MAKGYIPSITALRYRFAAEDAALKKKQDDEQAAIDMIATIGVVSTIALEDYIIETKDVSHTKRLAENYGFKYNPKDKSFYTAKASIGNKDVPPLKIPLSDMRDYKEVTSLHGDKSLKDVIMSKGVYKQYIVKPEDIVETLKSFGPKPGRGILGSKRAMKKWGRDKSYINQLFGDDSGYDKLVESMANRYDFGDTNTLEAINKNLNKQYGSFKDYFADLKTGLTEGTVEDLASYGTHGDTHIAMIGGELAHVNQEEVMLLQAYPRKEAEAYIMKTGSGTINEATGLKEYIAMEAIGAGAGIASAVWGIGSSLAGGYFRQKAAQDEVKNLDKQLGALSGVKDVAGEEKVQAMEDVMDTSQMQRGQLTSQTGEAYDTLASASKQAVKAGKGLVSGSTEQLLAEKQADVLEQTQMQMDTLTDSTEKALGDTEGKFNQQIADLNQQIEANRAQHGAVSKQADSYWASVFG